MKEIDGKLYGYAEELNKTIPDEDLILFHAVDTGETFISYNGAWHEQPLQWSESDYHHEDSPSPTPPTPTGVIDITENGEYDVTDYATADVSVPGPTGTKEIESNGTHNVSDYAYAQVYVTAKLQTIYIDNNIDNGAVTCSLTLYGALSTAGDRVIEATQAPTVYPGDTPVAIKLPGNSTGTIARGMISVTTSVAQLPLRAVPSSGNVTLLAHSDQYWYYNVTVPVGETIEFVKDSNV